MSGPALSSSGFLTPAPQPLRVGDGTAVFLDGRIAHPGAAIASLRISFAGVDVPALGFGAPEPGGEGDDYWWAIVPVRPAASPGSEVASLHATFDDGSEAGVVVGAVELAEDLEAPDEGLEPGLLAAGEDLVVICMATHEPDPELLRVQVESIRAQSHANWLCVISDDCSTAEGLAAIEAIVADDSRFTVSAAPQRQGFYRNFERALTMVPAQARWVALADQDDRWHPSKLERLIAGLKPGSRLVYSDMRLVDPDGKVLADTFWTLRPNNHTRFASLLLANTVSGAATLFQRSLLDDALPFPPELQNSYHDHWLAQVAMASGPLSYVDEALLDYTQLPDADQGHAASHGHGRFELPLRKRAAGVIEELRARGVGEVWRGSYFGLYCRISIAARVLEMRLGERLSEEARTAIRRSGDDPRGIAWLLAGSARGLVGANETLGRERAMLAGIAWRRWAEARRRLRLRGTLR